VGALSRTDLPTARQISENHVEGKTYNTEPVLVCGIAELVRTGQQLRVVSREVLEAALAAWWEYPSPEDLEEGLGRQLEAEVFMEPRIRAGHEHVPKLYELSRDQRDRSVAGRLAIAWLEAYPLAAPRVQKELLNTAIRFGPKDQVQDIVRQRVSPSDRINLRCGRSGWQRCFLSTSKIASARLQHSVMRIRLTYGPFGVSSTLITESDGYLFLPGSGSLSSNGSPNDGHRLRLHMVVHGETKMTTMLQNLSAQPFGPLGRIRVGRPPRLLIAW
jgi:hypothetical protein